MKTSFFFLILFAFNTNPAFAARSLDPNQVFAEALLAARNHNQTEFYKYVGEFRYRFQGRDGVPVKGTTRMDRLLAFEWMEYFQAKLEFGKNLNLEPLRSSGQGECHFSFRVLENNKLSDTNVEFICEKSKDNQLDSCKIIRITKGRFSPPNDIICR